ncbi:DciA family protein [Orrella sp. 11846]|uniref:DciA family protein n=1 Tax=Orrella sp. 11846 TaxID=3409913 RepID=UPI003B5A8D3E
MNRFSQPDRHPMQWLTANEQSSDLIMAAHRLLALEKHLKKCLPATLAQQVAVTAYEDNTLTLLIYHAAPAAKLRQMTSTLCQAMLRGGWNIKKIEIRMGTEPKFAHQETMERQARPLDADDLSHFEALQTQLEPGRLSDAIQALIKRHRPD